MIIGVFMRYLICMLAG